MRRLLTGLAVVMLAGSLAGFAAATNGKDGRKSVHTGKRAAKLHKFYGHPFFFRHMRIDKADIKTQDGEGVVQKNGATVLRTRYAAYIKMTMPTPEPGTYVYPEAPPDGPHPPVELFDSHRRELLAPVAMGENDLVDANRCVVASDPPAVPAPGTEGASVLEVTERVLGFESLESVGS